MSDEIAEMMAAIGQSQGDLGEYQQEFAKVSSQKSEVEADLNTASEKLLVAEKERQEMNDKKRKFEGDLGSFKKDIEDMEMACQRAEQVF